MDKSWFMKNLKQNGGQVTDLIYGLGDAIDAFGGSAQKAFHLLTTLEGREILFQMAKVLADVTDESIRVTLVEARPLERLIENCQFNYIDPRILEPATLRLIESNCGVSRKVPIATVCFDEVPYTLIMDGAKSMIEIIKAQRRGPCTLRELVCAQLYSPGGCQAWVMLALGSIVRIGSDDFVCYVEEEVSEGRRKINLRMVEADHRLIEEIGEIIKRPYAQAQTRRYGGISALAVRE